MEKNPHAVALGRLGGLKGGRAVMARLSPAERRSLALLGVAARRRKREAAHEAALSPEARAELAGPGGETGSAPVGGRP